MSIRWMALTLTRRLSLRAQKFVISYQMGDNLCKPVQVILDCIHEGLRCLLRRLHNQERSLTGLLVRDRTACFTHTDIANGELASFRQ